MLLRSRHRGQSVVEFGIIAILFTLIMFAVCDFGLLLNDWLSVSSGARLLARDAAVGMTQVDLATEATKLAVPGVSADAFVGGYCCGPTAALRVNVTFYNHCTPLVPGCAPVDVTKLDNRYTSNGLPGTCNHLLTICDHPSPPSA